MKTIDLSQFHKKTVELIRKVCTSMHPLALTILQSYSGEGSPSAFAASVLCQNAELAKKQGRPLCQDTGFCTFFVSFGLDIVPFDVQSALDDAVKEAYSDGFRLSVADAINRQNTQTNTPCELILEFVEGDEIKVDFLPRGFGAENMTKLYMLNPTVGTKGIQEAVLDAVRTAGSKPCPPYIVGVGVGGTAEQALILSKKQLMREQSHNMDKQLAELEESILCEVNNTEIGIQGFGGKLTAYAVNIAALPTHIAGLPVAVCFLCNAVRFGSFVL